jgi:F-type H+-transporting ATPase subunit epsilon
VRFELATPSRLLVSADVDEVVAPGSEGYFGVLPGHAPFLTTLAPGEVMYRQGRQEHYVAVAGGFAEVTGDRVIILAEGAETPEEIDRDRAERARERAEQRLAGRAPAGGQEEIDYDRALNALARALARIMVAGRGQHPSRRAA